MPSQAAKMASKKPTSQKTLSHSILNTAAINNIPSTPRAPHAVWIGILHYHIKDYDEANQEKSFQWCKCMEVTFATSFIMSDPNEPKRITIRTLKNYYYSRNPIEGLYLQHEDYFPEERDTVRQLVERASWSHNVIALRAVAIKEVDQRPVLGYCGLETRKDMPVELDSDDNDDIDDESIGTTDANPLHSAANSNNVTDANKDDASVSSVSAEDFVAPELMKQHKVPQRAPTSSEDIAESRDKIKETLPHRTNILRGPTGLSAVKLPATNTSSPDCEPAQMNSRDELVDVDNGHQLEDEHFGAAMFDTEVNERSTAFLQDSTMAIQGEDSLRSNNYDYNNGSGMQHTSEFSLSGGWPFVKLPNLSSVVEYGRFGKPVGYAKNGAAGDLIENFKTTSDVDIDGTEKFEDDSSDLVAENETNGDASSQSMYSGALMARIRRLPGVSQQHLLSREIHPCGGCRVNIRLKPWTEFDLYHKPLCSDCSRCFLLSQGDLHAVDHLDVALSNALCDEQLGRSELAMQDLELEDDAPVAGGMPISSASSVFGWNFASQLGSGVASVFGDISLITKRKCSSGRPEEISPVTAAQNLSK